MGITEDDLKSKLLYQREVAAITRKSKRTVRRRLQSREIWGRHPLYHIDDVIEAFRAGKSQARRLKAEAVEAINTRGEDERL